MMIGPMKKKVITASVVTAVVLILLFTIISVLFIMQNNKTLADLRRKSVVVQRYVFTRDLSAGTVVDYDDLVAVEVKGESAPDDSFEYNPDNMIGNTKVPIDEIDDIVGRRLKVNALEKTIVTASLFYDLDDEPAIDTRMQEYNMITLPSDLVEGDYIDVRIRFATGEDYSVIVGKKVEAIGALKEQSNSIFLRLSEEEIVRMSSAIIESYINKGVLLYANKYVDPSNQLYDYAYNDLVSKYKALNSETVSKVNSSGETVEELKERSNEEIASILGVSAEDVKKIKEAIASNDTETLSSYKNILVKESKSIEATYPVKTEVASLIKNNPNILQDVKAKYDVESLIAQRKDFLNTDLTKIDSYTGEVTNHDEHLTNLQEKLDKEIQTQRTERQQYLLKLIGTSTSTSIDSED